MVRTVVSGLLGLALVGAAAPLVADSATRLTDLVAGASDGIPGLDAAVVGADLYFVGLPGPSLYRYDGVNPPTMVPGSDLAEPSDLVEWNGRLYFQGGASDRELWVYDPAGPTLEEVLDVRPSSNGGPQRFAVFAGRLCFAAFSESNGFELFCWDGVTPPELLDIAPGSGGSYPEELTVLGSALYFVARPAGFPLVLRYDGVDPPEVVAAAPGETYEIPCCLAVAESSLFFEAEDSGGSTRLWRHDGVAAPTRVSATFEPWGYLGVFRDRLMVDGEDASAGVVQPELWRVVAGQLERVRPGAVVVSTEGHRTARTGLYFFGYPSTGSNTGEIYRYCGAGPVGVASGDFASAGATPTSERPIVFQDRIYVAADQPETGEELWVVEPSHLFCDDLETGDTSSW